MRVKRERKREREEARISDFFYGQLGRGASKLRAERGIAASGR